MKAALVPLLLVAGPVAAAPPGPAAAPIPTTAVPAPESATAAGPVEARTTSKPASVR